MFSIDTDLTIHITRGDVGVIDVSANKTEHERYIFQPGDIVRFRVYSKKKHDAVMLIKDTLVERESTNVNINLYSSDTKIGEIINKPTDYWYEIELNPDTTPHTIVGYDKAGPKIFRLYPEGGDRT